MSLIDLQFLNSVLQHYHTSLVEHMKQWNEAQPIFLQIRQQLIGLILKRIVAEGEALPSVRQVSTDLSVNPLTVTKAYQSLVDLNVIEKRRGLGMFVVEGAREKLLAHEKDKFLKEDWPRVMQQIAELELDPEALIKSETEK